MLSYCDCCSVALLAQSLAAPSVKLPRVAVYSSFSGARDPFGTLYWCYRLAIDFLSY